MKRLFLFFLLIGYWSVVRASDTVFIKEAQVPILIERQDNLLFYLRFDAYSCKDELKGLGFFFCSKKKAWAWTDENPKKNKYKMTLDEIRETYGSEIIKKHKDETKKLTGAA